MSSAVVVIGTLRVKIKICFIQLKAKGPENIFCTMMNYEEALYGPARHLTLSVPNFRQHLSSALFFFNKLSIGKKFMCKVEKLNVKQRRS